MPKVRKQAKSKEADAKQPSNFSSFTRRPLVDLGSPNKQKFPRFAQLSSQILFSRSFQYAANVKSYNPTTGLDRFDYPDNLTAEALLSASPNTFRHELVFIIVYLEANEGELTDIGLAYLDTRDSRPRLKPKVTEAAIPGDGRTGPWRKFIVEKHYSIFGSSVKRTRWTKGYPENFVFSKTRSTLQGDRKIFNRQGSDHFGLHNVPLSYFL